MDIRIKQTDYDMPSEVAQYLDERLASIEKLLAGDADVSRCEVEVGRDGHSKHGKVWFAEINIVRPGTNIHAREGAESVNAAIDATKDEVLRQLRKDKQLHRRVIRRSGAAAKWLMRFGRDENNEVGS